VKVYISGGMTGISEFNFPAFFDAEKDDRLKGATIFSPARNAAETFGIDVTGTTGKHDEIPTFNLREALRWDMCRICDSDAIFMLKGWEFSSGARAEHALANALKLRIIYQ
jgi:hypothetical protein